jgi:hypothetical protein
MYNQYPPQRQTSQTSQASSSSYNTQFSSYNPFPTNPPPNQQQYSHPSTPAMAMPNYSQTPTQGQPSQPTLQHSATMPASAASMGMPPGGFSTYSYQQQQQPQSASMPHIQPDIAYSIHQQAYRPTEAEAGAHAKVQLNQAGPPKDGKFDARVDRVEKGVGRFLKKLDKKI